MRPFVEILRSLQLLYFVGSDEPVAPASITAHAPSPRRRGDAEQRTPARQTAVYLAQNKPLRNRRKVVRSRVAISRPARHETGQNGSEWVNGRGRSFRKVVRLLIAFVVTFAVCMLPNHVWLLWQEWADLYQQYESSSWSYHAGPQYESYSYEQYMYVPPVMTLLFYVNSCLNPFLYALISDKFRSAVSEAEQRRWAIIEADRRHSVFSEAEKTLSAVNEAERGHSAVSEAEQRLSTRPRGDIRSQC